MEQNTVNIPETEAALLQGLAANDKKAVERIYRENFPVIQAMIVNNSGNPEDAADIFQEAMIVLYEKAKLPDFVLNCQIRTFVYSVCRRLWLKKLQQSQRFYTQPEATEEIVAVEEDMEYHESKQAEFNIMENALAKIGEPCKSLLEAYYLQKKGMQEISDLFGYTNADNAKTQKYKCLMRLKKLFFAQYKNNG